MPVLSPAEQSFITSGVDLNIRSDGRSRLDFRDIIIETGLLANASGSCRIKLDKTDVLVGVKAEVDDITAAAVGNGDKGRVVCTVDCSPSVTIGTSTRIIDDLSTMYSELLTNLFNSPSSGLDLTQLLIIRNSTVWTIYIDVLILDDGGNLVDAIVLGGKAALMNTKIPKTIVQDVGGQLEFEVSDDVDDMENLKGANELPVCVTVNKISNRHIVDATPLEESCSSASLFVFTRPAPTDRNTTVLSHIQKSGSGSIEPSHMTEMIQTGRKVGALLNKRLMEILEKEKNFEESARRKGKLVNKLGFFA